jgi:murein DD-endopeptidase MepM/ murein hydrolase activator NlpD
MNKLPELTQKVMARPGSSDFEPPYLVPDLQHQDFWQKMYDTLHQQEFSSPVAGNIELYINTEVGFFGFRKHPTKLEHTYYHIGVQLEFQKVQEITPIAQGVLEYAGYGAINGHYVLLSHPDIQTEDGYVLHSMYCHLKKPQVGFSSYQKMLREISLGTYPIVPISSQEVLGISGSSGVVEDDKPKLYLQLDFRKYGEAPIVLDPLMVFNNKTEVNSLIDTVS